MAEPRVRFKRDDGSSYPAWDDVVLGDIATRVTRKNTNGETDRPLTIASIEGLVDQRTYFGKTIASKDMSGYFLLKNGEYAYNKSYSAGYDYGSIKRLDKYNMGALSTLYICFALDEDQNTDFYDCYFNGLSWYNQMPQICAEGARNHGLLNVSPNDFFKIQLSVPSSKEEQQKIADFLSSVDEIITSSEQEVANLETQKKAVMMKIFSQEARFKRADGSDFPDAKKCSIGDVIIFSGGSQPDKKYFINEPRDGYIRLIQVQDYRTDKYATYIPLEKAKKFCDVDDVMIGRYGPPVFQIKRGLAGAYNVALIKASEKDKQMLLKEFMYYLLSRYDLYLALELVSRRSAGQSGVDMDLLNNFPILLPCLEEQRLIADFLSDFDEAIAAAKKELELWKELKKGLLQQMFV